VIVKNMLIVRVIKIIFWRFLMFVMLAMILNKLWRILSTLDLLFRENWTML